MDGHLLPDLLYQPSFFALLAGYPAGLRREEEKLRPPVSPLRLFGMENAAPRTPSRTRKLKPPAAAPGRLRASVFFCWPNIPPAIGREAKDNPLGSPLR